MTDDKYRYGVVGVFIDDSQRLLMCERKNLPGTWQFPQGGIDEGEDPVMAVQREMMEELGTDQFEILKAVPGLTSYEFPPNATFPLAKKFVGQKHHWFLLAFTSGKGPIIEKSDGEFQDFRWCSISDSLRDVVDWKRDAYLKGLTLLGLL